MRDPMTSLELRRSKEALCMEIIILIDVFLVLADGVSAACPASARPELRCTEDLLTKASETCGMRSNVWMHGDVVKTSPK